MLLNTTISYVIGLLSLAFIFYLYIKQKYSFWKSKGVLGPRPIPFIGNILPFFYTPIVFVERQRYNAYGKIYGFYDCFTPVLSLADPHLIKQITVKDWRSFINRRPLPFDFPPFNKILVFLEDEKWKSARSIISPTFTSGKIRRMVPIIDESIDGVLSNLKKAAETGGDVDAKRIFGAYTMDVTARCAFSTKTNAHTDPNDPFIQSILTMLKPNLIQVLLVFLLPKFINKILNSLNVFTPGKHGVHFFLNVSRHLLEERKKSGQKGNDFLQLLVDAEMPKEGIKRDVHDISGGHFQNENADDIERNAELMSNTVQKQKKLTEEDILSQMLMFFFVGYETTGSLLSYTAYLLATNPEKQDKLYQELKRSLSDELDVNYEALNGLDYLNAVISETLRIYPPLPSIDRVASDDYVLGSAGIQLPKGTPLTIPTYSIHHDPNNFPEPEEFQPERFLKEQVENIVPYTYLPFGAGPRNCIGMRFALIEAKLVLCRTVMQYKFVTSKNTSVPVQFDTSSGFLQPKDIVLCVEKRQATVLKS